MKLTMYKHEIWVNSQEETLRNALSTIAENVIEKNPKDDDSWDVYFPEVDLAIESKNNIEDFFASIKDDRLDDQCLRMNQYHKHSLVIIRGDLDRFVMDQFERRRISDPFLNDIDYKLIYKQIIGKMASTLVLSNILNICIFRELLPVCLMMVAVANKLENAEKIVDKKYILKRPPVPNSHLDKLNMIRCVKGFDLNTATKINSVVTLYDLVQPPREYIEELVDKVENKDDMTPTEIAIEALSIKKEDVIEKLSSIKGIGRKKAEKLLDGVMV